VLQVFLCNTVILWLCTIIISFVTPVWVPHRVRYCTVLYCTVQYLDVQYIIVMYSGCTIHLPYSTVMYSKVQYRDVQ